MTALALAQAEIERRRRHWPKAVADGQMTQAQADADLAAWERIALCIDHGFDSLDPIEDMVAASQRAVNRRATAVVEAKGTAREPAAERRLADVFTIARLVRRAAARLGRFPSQLEVA